MTDKNSRRAIDQLSANAQARIRARLARSKDGHTVSIPLPDTDLRLAILMVEDEEGRSEPVCCATTVNEGRELAESDLRVRMLALERGDDAGICPYEYYLWARDYDGTMRIVASWLVGDL
jgi:hypothetical protein